MIIKLEKIINCSSEHPSYPASTLLNHHSNASWRCAKPGEMLATVTFQLAEPSCIIGLDIGNYRSCVVIVTASTSSEPDNWIPIVNHQFMTHDEAANGKFKDQVQLFTKKELNPDTLKIKFDRVKVTCMQSANLRELFGLTFILLRTEVTVDLGLDAFGKFKLKKNDSEERKSHIDEFKEKYLKLVNNNKKNDYKNELLAKIKETGINNFSKRQEEGREPMKRPLLEKLEAGKTDEVFGTKIKASSDIGELNKYTSKDKMLDESMDNDKSSSNDKPVARTPFGDIIISPVQKQSKNVVKDNTQRDKYNSQKRSLSPIGMMSDEAEVRKRLKCIQCNNASDDTVCKTCNRLPPPKPSMKHVEMSKRKKLFAKLFDDVSFSLSGYVNPQRDEIRRKALKMGAKYVADPDTRNNKCTHLICAFKNTPKHQQLKGHSKIVSHMFIEDCFNKKLRLPWRRYALDSKEKAEPESEDEIVGCTSPNVFVEDTDSDSNY